MRRLIIAVLFGLFAMPMFGRELSAQARPGARSSVCIPSQKERGNACRIDTVKVYVRDTLRLEGRVEYRDRLDTRIDTIYMGKKGGCFSSWKCPTAIAGAIAAGTAVYCLAIDKNHCHRSKVEVDNSNSVVVNGVSRMRVLPYVGRQRFGVSGSFSFGR